MDSFEGEDMDVIIPPHLDPGEKKLVLVTHDETCFDSHDSKRTVWVEGDKNALKPKGSGKSIMVSQFLCQCHGHMEVTLTESILKQFPLAGNLGETIATLRTIKPGKNADGYWDNKDLVEQTKCAIVIFEILHPGCSAVFAFDNSANHHARAPDALIASRLNKSDGGKNVPFLRPGWFMKDGVRIQQCMQFSDSNGKSIQKGTRSILLERDLWETVGMSANYARKFLASQPDFLEQKEWLEETVLNKFHQIIFYPKFHPEFNWIEMFWGATKHYTRKHCTYSFKDLERIVPEALKVTSLSTMRKFARKSFRYMDIYRSGRQLTPKQIEHAMKLYSSHRSIPVSILDSL